MAIYDDILKISPNLVNDLGVKVIAQSDIGMGSHVDFEGKNVIIRFTWDRGLLTEKLDPFSPENSGHSNS
jgi:hypothetical protein